METSTGYRILAKTFARRLGHNLLVVLALSVALIFGVATQEDVAITRPAVRGSARRLVETNDCDNQDDPTHVVVTVDGVTRYAGQKLTDKAIEQEMFGVDHGLTVHAFCL